MNAGGVGGPQDRPEIARFLDGLDHQHERIGRELRAQPGERAVPLPDDGKESVGSIAIRALGERFAAEFAHR